MAWIESHQALQRHPKVLGLATRMGWDLDQTLGKLHRLWWWVLDFAPDGRLDRFPPETIAQAIGGPADRGGALMAALTEEGFLDSTPCLRIHDWWDYCGRYLQIKYKHESHKWMQIRSAYVEGGPRVREPLVVRQDNRKMQEWSRKVKARDGKVCQRCGESGTSLHVHHIKRQADFPSLIFAEWNGITLCKKCHKSLYGKEELYEEALFERVRAKYTDSERESILQSIRKVCPDRPTETDRPRPTDRDRPTERKIRISAPPARTRRVPAEALSAPIWTAYAAAYRTRYGVDPQRNQRVNATLTQLRERVGVEQAPAVAAFYVTHNDALYVRSRHPTTLLLRDAEGLMTQMRTGQKATRQEAQQAEAKDSIREQVARVSVLLGARHDAQ